MFTIRYWSPNGDSLGTITAPAEAARSWLEGKIDANWPTRASRAELLDGREVVAVYECNTAGEMIQTADRNGDTEMADEATEPQTEEAAPNKGQTKVGRALELMQREGGVTVAEIAEKTGTTPKAARSLVADIKRAGYDVVRESDKDTEGKSVSVYKVSA